MVVFFHPSYLMNVSFTGSSLTLLRLIIVQVTGRATFRTILVMTYAITATAIVDWGF